MDCGTVSFGPLQVPFSELGSQGEPLADWSSSTFCNEFAAGEEIRT